MSDDELTEVFGEEFADHIRQKTAERREERNRLGEEEIKKVCARAINEEEFKEGEPMFKHVSDNRRTHTIMLVQVPDPNGSEVWEYLSEPWDGAANLPLDYLGEWHWATFPDKQDVANINQGDYLIVAGDIDEQESDDGSDTTKTISPVRACVPLGDAQEYAQDAKNGDFGQASSNQEDEEDGEEVEEEQTTESEEDGEEEVVEETGSEEEEEDDDEGGSMMFGGEEEEEQSEDPVDYDKIAAMVEQLSEDQDEDDEPQVFEIEEGSSHHKRLTQVVIKRSDDLEEEDLESVGEVVIDVIQNHEVEDEEEEEDDDDGGLFQVGRKKFYN